MEPLVTEIMRLIDTRADDPRLLWSADRTTVKVIFSRLIMDSRPIPAAHGRRAPFGAAWRAAMAEHGWVPVGPSGVFTRPGLPGD